jgi:hypothetical protein
MSYNEPSQTKLRIPLHSCANGQSKNKCSMVSSSPLLRMTQKILSWMCKCLLRNIGLVFNRSTRTSQAKNLMCRVHFDFQTTMKITCTSTLLRKPGSKSASKYLCYPRWAPNDLQWYHHTGGGVAGPVGSQTLEKLAMRVEERIGYQGHWLA